MMTHRCVYCRPTWTFGIRSRLLRKLVALIWPPHIIGEDHGAPYTDGICHLVEARLLVEQKAREKAAQDRRMQEWALMVNRIHVGNPFMTREYWIHLFQAMRRIETGTF